jgi:RsiW-degrading membrane proteinase PrsW (M82 family)
MSPRAPGRRDPQFLWMAAFAAATGLSAIGWSIGMPVYQAMHGEHPSWIIVHFSAWGFFALFGAAACINTYFQTGNPPRRPPRGGRRVVPLAVVQGRAKPPAASDQDRRAA